MRLFIRIVAMQRQQCTHDIPKLALCIVELLLEVFGLG